MPRTPTTLRSDSILKQATPYWTTPNSTPNVLPRLRGAGIVPRVSMSALVRFTTIADSVHRPSGLMRTAAPLMFDSVPLLLTEKCSHVHPPALRLRFIERFRTSRTLPACSRQKKAVRGFSVPRLRTADPPYAMPPGHRGIP